MDWRPTLHQWVTLCTFLAPLFISMTPSMMAVWNQGKTHTHTHTWGSDGWGNFNQQLDNITKLLQRCVITKILYYDNCTTLFFYTSSTYLSEAQWRTSRTKKKKNQGLKCLPKWPYAVSFTILTLTAIIDRWPNVHFSFFPHPVWFHTSW